MERLFHKANSKGHVLLRDEYGSLTEGTRSLYLNEETIFKFGYF